MLETITQIAALPCGILNHRSNTPGLFQSQIDGLGNQREKGVRRYIAPENCRQNIVGVLPQAQDSSGVGVPDYANGSPKANSHVEHNMYDCVDCHSGVVNASGAGDAFDAPADAGHTIFPITSEKVRVANGTTFPYGFGWAITEQRGQRLGHRDVGRERPHRGAEQRDVDHRDVRLEPVAGFQLSATPTIWARVGSACVVSRSKETRPACRISAMAASMAAIRSPSINRRLRR